MTIKEKLEKIRNLVEDGLQTDGGHHKQWYLEQIGEVIGIDIDKEMHEEGIAP